jgi:hypothetical protein
MTENISLDFVYGQKSYQAELQPVNRQDETQYEVVAIDPELRDTLNGYHLFALENGLVSAGDAAVTGEAAPLRQAIAAALDSYLLMHSG